MDWELFFSVENAPLKMVFGCFLVAFALCQPGDAQNAGPFGEGRIHGDRSGQGGKLKRWWAI